MMRILGDWLLLPKRFALHEPSGTAVLADLHLGYSAARQRLGDAIPLRGVEEELAPLIAAAAVHPIHALVVAGDLFERGFDAAIFQEWLDVLDRLKIRFLDWSPAITIASGRKRRTQPCRFSPTVTISPAGRFGTATNRAMTDDP